MRTAVCIALAIAGLAGGAQAGAATFVASPRVTVIGDSVLTAVLWNEEPRRILSRGFDVELHVGPCRRVTGESCLFQDGKVPTVVDLVNELRGELGETVIVEVGYNDDPVTFAQSVEEAITTLLGAGAKRILWVNMREKRQQYVRMNKELRAVAGRHPEVTIVDWDRYSRERYPWFQSDGIHLGYEGAIAMATFLYGEITDALAPPLAVVSTQLPVGRTGRPYSARLVVQGGTAPYRWRSASGPLPQGLRLLAGGSITGTPRRAAKVRLTLSAADVFGHEASVRVTLTINAGKACGLPTPRGWAAPRSA